MIYNWKNELLFFLLLWFCSIPTRASLTVTSKNTNGIITYTITISGTDKEEDWQNLDEDIKNAASIKIVGPLGDGARKCLFGWGGWFNSSEIIFSKSTLKSLDLSDITDASLTSDENNLLSFIPNYENLEKITFPRKCSIPMNCLPTSVKTIVFPDAGESDDYIDVASNCFTQAYCNLQSVTVGTSVRSFGDGAFSNSSVSKVVFD